jgi:hypothetical protein
MIAVILAATLCACGEMLWRRRAGYLRQARIYEQKERSLNIDLKFGVRTRRGVQLLLKELRRYNQLKKKYVFAADHPWLYVEPDPPPPK